VRYIPVVVFCTQATPDIRISKHADRAKKRELLQKRKKGQVRACCSCSLLC
jgi:hypothetical protein